MNKQEFALAGLMMTAVTFATGLIVDNVSGLDDSLTNHSHLPCHPVACEKINNIEKIVQEEHCINVKQIKGENPLDCLED